MKILTAAEMAAADRRTQDVFGVSMAELMRAAGEAVARFVMRQYPRQRQVTVLCGTGNNGGDGFVAAHALARAGYQVSVVLLGSEEKLKGEAARYFAVLERAPIAVHAAETVESLHALEDLFAQTELFIDAVVGTGFKPPLRDVAATVRDRLAGLKAKMVAVDLPSGWDADYMGERQDGAFRADAVVTFTAPKLAHVLGHLTSAVFGPVVVAEIGSPADAIQSAQQMAWGPASKCITEKARPINSNKGKYGHVLLIGGARGKAGAPSMASLAALRAGAGLVTAAVAKSILNNVAMITPELMTTPLEEEELGVVSLANLEPQRLEKLLKKISVLAIGPGLGTEGDASAFVRKLVHETALPVVLDADALNAFAGKAELLNGKGRTMVLTPHPGEMATLLGVTVKDVEADRVNLARRFATEHSLTLVLKGWRTLIAHPDGTVAVNTSGNPAMAKGGSGDILTGIVAAMLAQHPDEVADAVNAAVYVHGLAADFAAHAQDEKTVLATDTAAHLSDAFRYRTRDVDGFMWIAGVHRRAPGGREGGWSPVKLS